MKVQGLKKHMTEKPSVSQVKFVQKISILVLIYGWSSNYIMIL